jgi:predicted nucleic acid-binding protein
MIILDTNVYSELKGRRFSDHLLHWLDDLPASNVFLTTITIAETEFGLGLLPDGERRKKLSDTYAQLETEFAQRILPFSTVAARQYGVISARRILWVTRSRPRTP